MYTSVQKQSGNVLTVAPQTPILSLEPRHLDKSEVITDVFAKVSRLVGINTMRPNASPRYRSVLLYMGTMKLQTKDTHRTSLC